MRDIGERRAKAKAVADAGSSRRNVHVTTPSSPQRNFSNVVPRGIAETDMRLVTSVDDKPPPDCGVDGDTNKFLNLYLMWKLEVLLLRVIVTVAMILRMGDMGAAVSWRPGIVHPVHGHGPVP